MSRSLRALPQVLALLIALVVVNSGMAMVYEDGAQPKPFIIKGSIAVKFTEDVNVASLKTAFGMVATGIPSLDKVMADNQIAEAHQVFPWRKVTDKNASAREMAMVYELRFPESLDPDAVVRELEQNPHVAWAKPNYAFPLTASPNDPQWSDQWAMEPPGPDPYYYTAWNYETGSDSIIVAIIDSGVKYAHEDLRDNIWVNPGEDLDGDRAVMDTDDLNGIDDDGNGVIDDLIGYDFFTGLSGDVWPGEDPNTPDPDPDDFNGHGTHVSGIVAAATNNLVGVTGAAGGWFGGHPSKRGVRIMCLRAGATGIDGLGYVNTLNCATALDYAADNGAQVVNASWGTSSQIGSALSNALAAGMTVCHAAGNDDDDNPDYMDFISGVLSIASTGPYSDLKSDFSNWGDWVDLSAPGSSILSTYSFSGSAGYASIGGTSMSSPMAAGLAALIRSMMPSLTKDQVDSIMLATADSVSLYAANPLYLSKLGRGRIDAALALSSLPNAKFTSDVTQGPAPLTVQFADLSPNSPTAWEWTFGTGDGSTDQNPQYTYDDPGLYSVSLKENEGHPLGWGEEHLKDYIWVTADTLQIDSVEATMGSPVKLSVRLHNTALIKEIQFPFTYNNSLGVTYDSFSTEGLRTGYFESVTVNAFDPFFKRLSILMKTNATTGSNYLPVDTGVILDIWFTAGGNNGVVAIDTQTVSGKIPKITTIYGTYFPGAYTSGKILVSGCCVGDRGNVDGDENDEVNISDIVYFVDFMFGDPQGPPPPCEEEGDVDASEETDIADLVYLVEYSFNSGPAPLSCSAK